MIFSEPPRTFEVDREASLPAAGRLRFTVRKPRLPWTYKPRSTTRRIYSECGRGRVYHDLYSTPEGLAAAIRKKCGPRKARRQFDPGGPEAGTLAEARRAGGLFDENWDREFPTTRKEREVIAAGGQVADFFFEPPTTPAPENWIDDKLKRIRGTFGPTKYFTPKAMQPFCPAGGYGIDCSGPDGNVAWIGGDRPLTPLETKRFTDAYCAAGQCQTPGKIDPPAGFKEISAKVKPRNAAVLLKASCQPVLAPGPVIMDVLLPLPGAAPEAAAALPSGAVTPGCPAGWYWTIGLTGVRCVPAGSGLIAATQAQVIAVIGQSVWDHFVALGTQGITA